MYEQIIKVKTESKHVTNVFDVCIQNVKSKLVVAHC